MLSAGVNGMQPNLDLINLATITFPYATTIIDQCNTNTNANAGAGAGAGVGVCDGVFAVVEEGLLSLIEVLRSRRSVAAAAAAADEFVLYVQRLCGMFGFMSVAAVGPSGLHAHFLK